MKFRAIKNKTSFFIVPSIFVVYDDTWYGHYEIAFIWLDFQLCLEWGYED